MARLIAVPDPQGCRPNLTLRAGDPLLFQATGGRVAPGGDAVEMIGPLLQAVVGSHGDVVTPTGAPNAVLFRALRPGRAVVEVVTGDPWRGPRTTKLGLTVES